MNRTSSGTKYYGKRNKYKNKFTRALFFLIGDTFSLILSAVISYLIISSFAVSLTSFPIELTIVIISSVLIGMGVFRMYLTSWGYTSIRDLLRLILGILVGGCVSLTISKTVLVTGDYAGVFNILLLINSVLLIGGFRISKRIYNGLIGYNSIDKKHTIIFGGKSEGEEILRGILAKNRWNLSVDAIFDDRLMRGLLLHGIRVQGGQDDMIEYIQERPVDLLIIAYPEFPKHKLKDLIEEIKSIQSKIDIKLLHSFHSITDNPVGVQHLRDIAIEDILGRDPVEIDMKAIKEEISRKSVLVTGAAGSIGSELVRQCSKANPEEIIALDIDETDLFNLKNELKNEETKIIPYVANIEDGAKLSNAFTDFSPDIVFHAAAYKHVPMMERFPKEAIKVNVGGTLRIANLACQYEVEKFIMVSTDKAVNPTNVMGATKRMAEEICMAKNGMSETKFISVRFGNVLGSRGSVVPIFINQIARGGPITVTDPRMKRYFMTIPEAVVLVMQAGTMGKGGEVFVLDMGEPVRIIDMAKDLIRLHSLEPGKDIKIKITGMRPGEKLFEELLTDKEGIINTMHKEIFKAVCNQ